MMKLYFKEDSKMNIEELLNDEIQDELENLSKMELGSDTYKVTVEGLTKLVDKSIELEKVRLEMSDKAENRETELDLKHQQIQNEKRDQVVRNGIAIAGLIVPTIITIWGTLKTLKFEETGTVTTIMGRGFIQKLLPKK